MPASSIDVGAGAINNQSSVDGRDSGSMARRRLWRRVIPFGGACCARPLGRRVSMAQARVRGDGVPAYRMCAEHSVASRRWPDLFAAPADRCARVAERSSPALKG